LKIAVDREAAVVELDADGALDIVTVSDSFNRGVMRTTYGIASGCPADLNADGLLNFFDLAAYLALFSGGDPAADLAPPSGVLNFFDLSAYLSVFNAGCP
jgi:glycosylphosphatidylinositol phospholipase D